MLIGGEYSFLKSSVKYLAKLASANFDNEEKFRL